MISCIIKSSFRKLRTDDEWFYWYYKIWYLWKSLTKYPWHRLLSVELEQTKVLRCRSNNIFDLQEYSWEYFEIVLLIVFLNMSEWMFIKLQGMWGVLARCIFITKIAISQLCEISGFMCSHFPSKIYLFKVNNRNTRKRYEIWSKLTTKTERRQWRCVSVFIVNFEHISHLFLNFLFFTLNK